MKNETFYNKTVNILVQAYFNDTLRHGDCEACAVGNIIAANCNGEVNVSWYGIFGTVIQSEQTIRTGYTTGELSLIENAFENRKQSYCNDGALGDSKDERMFKGLMAVINALDEIHENKDAAVTEKSKQRFCKV